MPFDVLVTRAVATELEALVGSRVERVVQSGAEEVAVAFYGAGVKAWLFFSAQAAHARLNLAPGQVGREDRVSPFLLALRHHLEGAQLQAVSQPPMERVIILRLQGPAIRGGRAYHLIAEIMGRHSNLILVDPETDQIIDGLKRYSHVLSRYREVLPGRPYLSPPRNKVNPLDLTEEEWPRVLLSAGEGRPLEKVLVERLEGFGPCLARELAVRAGLDPGRSLEFLGAYDFARLWQAWRELRAVMEEKRFEPTLIVDRGRVVDYAAIALRQFEGLEQVRLPTMSSAIDRYYSDYLSREVFDREKRRLKQIVLQEQERWVRKLEVQEEILLDAEKAEVHRQAGQVILCNLYRLERGMRSVEGPNPDRPDEMISVELDPSLDPAENAQRFFRRYRKAKVLAEKAAAQLEQARRELAYWESVALALERAETREDLAEIADEVGAQLRPAGRRSGKRGKQKPAEPLRFTSPDGYDVLVGKNNRQNDYICVRLARPEDVWLHARGVAGAHVLVRNPSGGPLPAPTLRFAAGLAAFFSRASGSRAVPVDYTLAKHVHKPKGARPGMVLYTHQSTLAVPPTPPSGGMN
ncbi:MAG: NFACT RNA binding domain-containing protein [Clostridia bacterium]|jgi:predicted ribosome quality control (RQC) complex YloA/Tae2 family protein|nr:NFACT family protein [Clostridia bacterium]MDH7572145.1 NFACT RNA binding domain-containing protein [Clostridia bacterium]